MDQRRSKLKVFLDFDMLFKDALVCFSPKMRRFCWFKMKTQKQKKTTCKCSKLNVVPCLVEVALGFLYTSQAAYDLFFKQFIKGNKLLML